MCGGRGGIPTGSGTAEVMMKTSGGAITAGGSLIMTVTEMEIHPDEKSPTASGNTLKSGYGIQETVTAGVSTNQSHAVTEAQNAITYFPEFDYQSYWRVLERMGRGYQTRFEFEENPFSTYERRTHFLPIWYPDGSYTPYTWLIDCWTPAGMLSMNLTDSVRVRGNLWQDWHISPQKPR